VSVVPKVLDEALDDLPVGRTASALPCGWILAEASMDVFRCFRRELTGIDDSHRRHGLHHVSERFEQLAEGQAF
jgi:hypothetical protein